MEAYVVLSALLLCVMVAQAREIRRLRKRQEEQEQVTDGMTDDAGGLCDLWGVLTRLLRRVKVVEFTQRESDKKRLEKNAQVFGWIELLRLDVEKRLAALEAAAKKPAAKDARLRSAIRKGTK